MVRQEARVSYVIMFYNNCAPLSMNCQKIYEETDLNLFNIFGMAMQMFCIRRI
jgi:hypothetical protein